MDIVLGIFLGIGLSAACGFRVFVPFLIMSITKLSGHADVVPGFDWVGTWPAFFTLLVATILEVLAYYVPWVDNVLDMLATPAAAVAGVIATSSAVSDLSPLLEWLLALMGGGVATTVQVSTVALRGASTGTTGGFGNPVVATGELAGSAVTSLVSIIVPIVAGVLIVAGGVVLAFIFKRKLTT